MSRRRKEPTIGDMINFNRYDRFGYDEADVIDDTDPSKIYPSHMEWILKRERPYSYPPFYVWGREDRRATGVYSDRLREWDSAKCEQLAIQVWGKRQSILGGGEYAVYNWKDPAGVEKFLQLYNDDPTIVVTAIVEYCNVSNGYPVWCFLYTNAKLRGEVKNG